MRNIAEATGGSVVEPDEQSQDSARKLQSFHAPITQVYRLEVVFPQAIDRPRTWELEVIDATGQKLKNVELAYPRLLVPSLR